MKTKLVNIFVALSLLLAISTPAFSWDFFSYTELHFPDVMKDEPWLEVIDNHEDWEAFYLGVAPLFTDLAPELQIVPEIDFDNFTVIAGGLGIRPSRASRLSVESVINAGDTVFVNLLWVVAGQYCASPASTEYPTTVMLIRKSDKQLTFHLDEVVHECEPY